MGGLSACVFRRAPLWGVHSMASQLKHDFHLPPGVGFLRAAHPCAAIASLHAVDQLTLLPREPTNSG